MIYTRSIAVRFALLITLLASLTVLSSRIQADTGTCGGVSITLPFTDVMASPFFCQIAGAYYSGLTNGTTATTYSPTQNVTREQMAAFITRTLDQSLKRGNQRAAQEKWWTPQVAANLPSTAVGGSPIQVKFDGADLWVANQSGNSVSRVRASDGKVLETWTGATAATGIVIALGKIFISGQTSPGKLYMIDPSQPAGAVTTVSSNLGNMPSGIAFDGTRIWTANEGGSVSIITLNPTTVSTVTSGYSIPRGVLYDGANIWVTDLGTDSLLRVGSNGHVAQTISLTGNAAFPAFDGTNLWVPIDNPSSIIVVRTKDATGNALTTPFILTTLTGNGLNNPISCAFDGERMLTTNQLGSSVSLWKAADLTPLGSSPVTAGALVLCACSDGVNFWVTTSGNAVTRF